MRVILHKHHVKPRHIGGTDGDGLILCTPEIHAYFHRILYGKYGRWQDRLAYKGLEKNPEFWDDKLLEYRKAGGRTSKTCPKRISKLFSKTYILEDSEGVTTEITNLAEYCKENGFNRNTFIRHRNKDKLNYYGYKVFNFDPATGLRTCE